MMVGDSPENEDCQWCEVCRLHASGHCDGCHRRFDPGEVSYKSVSYHFHPAHICGVSGSMGVNKLLCVACYRTDYSTVYPKMPPVQLPDRSGPAQLTLVGGDS